MPTDPMTMERLGDIENRLDEAWGDPELMEGLAGDHIRDLCTALREAWERGGHQREAVAAFAFGRDYMLDPFCTPEWQRVIEVLGLQNG